jgi:hypothetical protein
MWIILQDALSGKHSYAYNALKSAWLYRPHLVIVYSADVIVLVVCSLEQQVALPPLHLHTQLTLVREIRTTRFPHLHNKTPTVITAMTWWHILCVAVFAGTEITKVSGFNDPNWVQLSLGVRHAFGAHDQIFLFFLLLPNNCFILHLMRCPLWREDESVICSAICQWSESWRTRSISVASYDSQGYGGGILTRLHTGL